MNVEDHGLHEGLEMFSDKSVLVLHHIGGSDGGNAEAVDFCTLKTDDEEILSGLGPRRMHIMPHIFDDAEKNGVENLDWCILARVQA